MRQGWRGEARPDLRGQKGVKGSKPAEEWLSGARRLAGAGKAAPAAPGFGGGVSKAGREPLPRYPGSRSQSQTPGGEPQSPTAPPSPALTLTGPPRTVRTRGAPALSAGGADGGALRGDRCHAYNLKNLCIGEPSYVTGNVTYELSTR